MDFTALIEESESAEIALGSTACLLIDEMFRHSTAPLFTQEAMRIKRVYDLRLERAERLRAKVERGEVCSAN